MFCRIFLCYVETLSDLLFFYVIVFNRFIYELSIVIKGLLIWLILVDYFYLLVLMNKYFYLFNTLGNLILFQVKGDRFLDYDRVVNFMV